MARRRAIIEAIYRLYEHSQFSMAGAVAFALVVSIFPFCIFLGALAGMIGGQPLAAEAVKLLFQVLPEQVAAGLAPEVEAALGRTQIDILTLGGAAALFFATSAIETLRSALNGAYRVFETRPYPLCLAFSVLFVFVNAVGMLVLTWVIVVGPAVAARYDFWVLEPLMHSTLAGTILRYVVVAAVIATQLCAMHIWLAAGQRTLKEVWPGVLLSVTLALSVAGLYSYYLDLTDYTRFYAGLSQLMVALIYFQVTAVIVILGAELNRGIVELKKLELKRKPREAEEAEAVEESLEVRA